MTLNIPITLCSCGKRLSPVRSPSTKKYPVRCRECHLREIRGIKRPMVERVCSVGGHKFLGGHNAKTCPEHRKPWKVYCRDAYRNRVGKRGKPPSNLIVSMKELHQACKKMEKSIDTKLRAKAKNLSREEKERIAKSMGMEMAA